MVTTVTPPTVGSGVTLVTHITPERGVWELEIGIVIETLAHLWIVEQGNGCMMLVIH